MLDLISYCGVVICGDIAGSNSYLDVLLHESKIEYAMIVLIRLVHIGLLRIHY